MSLIKLIRLIADGGKYERELAANWCVNILTRIYHIGNVSAIFLEVFPELVTYNTETTQNACDNTPWEVW